MKNRAIKILKELEFDGTIYIPEYNNKKFKYYTEQVEWEREVYLKCSIMMFWIPRNISKNILGLTTNVEFGYYLCTGKIIYGRPDNADRTRYLDWLYDLECKRKPYNNLRCLISETINILNTKKEV